MKTLDGRVAVVHDGGSDVGRAVALALSARGARIVVSGPEEKRLGETVGEIAYGGGKARHVVGDLSAGAARAREVFGAVDLAVAGGAAALAGAGAERRVLVAEGEAGPAAGCTTVAYAPGSDPDHVAELVVAVATARLGGRVVTLR